MDESLKKRVAIVFRWHSLFELVRMRGTGRREVMETNKGRADHSTSEMTSLDVASIQQWPVYLSRTVNAGMDQVFNCLVGKDHDLVFVQALKDNGKAYDIKLLKPWSAADGNEFLEDADTETSFTRELEWTVPISSPFAASTSCRNVQQGKIVAKRKRDWTSDIAIQFSTRSFDIPVSDSFETRVSILLVPTIDGQTIVHIAAKVEFLKALPLLQKMLKPIIQSMGTSGLESLWTLIGDRLVSRFA